MPQTTPVVPSPFISSYPFIVWDRSVSPLALPGPGDRFTGLVSQPPYFPLWVRPLSVFVDHHTAPGWGAVNRLQTRHAYQRHAKDPGRGRSRDLRWSVRNCRFELSGFCSSGSRHQQEAEHQCTRPETDELSSIDTGERQDTRAVGRSGRRHRDPADPFVQ